MEIGSLLQQARTIWGENRLSLPQIIIRLGTVFGDLCRWERDATKDRSLHNDQELKKEFGNIIFSTIRWCDDLGYDPEECVNIAIESQREFKKNNPHV